MSALLTTTQTVRVSFWQTLGLRLSQSNKPHYGLPEPTYFLKLRSHATRSRSPCKLTINAGKQIFRGKLMTSSFCSDAEACE